LGLTLAGSKRCKGNELPHNDIAVYVNIFFFLKRWKTTTGQSPTQTPWSIYIHIFQLSKRSSRSDIAQ